MKTILLVAAAGTRLRSIPLDARASHYRSGFGLASVTRAREGGFVALCDHSIVHSLSFSKLVAGPSARLASPWKVLADARRRAAAGRGDLHAIGRQNEVLVRGRYRQCDYGRALLDLYTRLGEAAS